MSREIVPRLSFYFSSRLPQRFSNMTRRIKDNEDKAQKPSPKSSAAKPTELEWGGFINLRLTELQKNDFKIWFTDNNDTVSDRVESLLIDGFKLSIAFNADNDTFSASVIGCLLVSSQKRYAVSAYAPNWWQAIALVIYKHFVIAEQKWDDFKPSKQGFDDIG